MYVTRNTERLFLILTVSDYYSPNFGKKCKVPVQCSSEKETLLREGAYVGQGCAWLLVEVAEVIPKSTSGFHARISCTGFSVARQIIRRVCQLFEAHVVSIVCEDCTDASYL